MPREKKYLRVEPVERVDYPDFRFQSWLSQFKGLTQIGHGLLVGPDRERAAGESDAPAGYVIKGFDLAFSGTQLTVNGGTAILGYTLEGSNEYGAVLTTPPGESLTVDLSNIPAGQQGTEHNIYLKFSQTDAEHTNRVFWNSAAATPTEVIRTIATRHVDDWEIEITTTNKGDPWILIGTVVPNTGTLADRRNFLFDLRASGANGGGNNHASFVVEDEDWGGINDALGTRGRHGIFGLGRFVKFALRQIQDIIGVGNPFSRSFGTSTGQIQSLNDMTSGKLSRAGFASADAAGTMNGELSPSADNQYPLGRATNRWSNVVAEDATISDNVACARVNATGDINAGDDITATGKVIAVEQVIGGGYSGAGSLGGFQNTGVQPTMRDKMPIGSMFGNQMIKAWGTFSTVVGTPFTINETEGVNVASTTRVDANTIAVTLTTPMNSSVYAVFATLNLDFVTGGTNAKMVYATKINASTFHLSCSTNLISQTNFDTSQVAISWFVLGMA